MAILISPVGDSDPVRNDYDGPLLHILRHHPCDQVYLLYTEEMSRRAEADSRYARTVAWIQPQCRITEIHTGIGNAHDFDGFSGPFQGAVARVQAEHPDQEILINITSGTPQMMATLCLIAVSGPDALRPVQVGSPSRSSNRNTPHAEQFDEASLENSLDNLEEAENRCLYPDILVYKQSMMKSRILSMLRRYDYAGALAEARSDVRIQWPQAFLLHLEAANLRFALKTEEAKRFCREQAIAWDYADFRNASDLAEYFMVAAARREQGNLWEFVLRLSPMLQKLLEDFLELRLKLPVSKLTVTDRKSGIVKIDPYKVEAYDQGLKEHLDQQFKGELRATFLGGHLLLNIAEYGVLSNPQLPEQDHRFFRDFCELRGAEEKVRNTLAHTMAYVTEEMFQRAAGCSSGKMERTLRSIILQLYGKHLRVETFSVYQEMNDRLEAMLAD